MSIIGKKSTKLFSLRRCAAIMRGFSHSTFKMDQQMVKSINSVEFEHS
jgi:hypothetical protein